MNRIAVRWGMCIVLLGAGAPALAQHSCSLNVTSLSTAGAVDPFNAASVDTVGNLSITCTRPINTAPRYPAQFWVSAANGNNHDGSTRRMRLGATSSYIPYTLYTATDCATAWDTVTAITLANTETQNKDVVTGPNPLTTNFCFRIPGSQTTAAPGSYTDSVNIQIRSTNSAGFVWATAIPFTFSTTVNAACTYTTPVANMTLNYTSFSASAVNATSPFGVRCTNTTSYDLLLDNGNTPVNSALLGINYTLTLSGTGGTGNGLTQNYSVDATAAAGQSGACATPSGCSAVNNHQVTVRY